MLVAGDMVFAVTLVHSAAFFSLTKSGAWSMELEAFYFFGAVAILLLGGGRYSVLRNMGKWD